MENKPKLDKPTERTVYGYGTSISLGGADYFEAPDPETAYDMLKKVDAVDEPEAAEQPATEPIPPEEQ
jgi:hypothetical protein